MRAGTASGQDDSRRIDHIYGSGGRTRSRMEGTDRFLLLVLAILFALLLVGIALSFL
jgi:hypothetical protein